VWTIRFWNNIYQVCSKSKDWYPKILIIFGSKNIQYILIQILFIYRLKHKDVFQLIRKHDLFGSISDKIVNLMEFDKDQAVNMLLDNMNKIPVSNW